ncbi:polysaccharide biosynthesis protein [Polynucleobacter paneuropaeus]|nr:polysaccharide biosynthesis protein [Polynucleobacter paneuropaeus]MBT8630104.1 polysaccharide biosynthesis protein [Polynucleobacter paneuropaeus]
MPANTLAIKTLKLPRNAKRGIALLFDFCLCILAVWFAFYLRIGFWVPLSSIPPLATVLGPLFALPIFIAFGFYRAIFRFSGWPALVTVAKAAAIYGVMYAAVFTVIGIQDVPRTVGIIQPILLLILVVLLRALVRFWLGSPSRRAESQSSGMARVLVYGAGSAGRQLVAAIQHSYQLQVVGYLDDDPSIQGGVLDGLSVFNPKKLVEVANKVSATDILLAIPSITRTRRNQIIESVSRAKLSVRTLPNLSDLAQGKITVSDVRELDIDDLLGRESVAPDLELLSKNITGKVVMVTGAGGSIGGELCRQIIGQKPKALIILDLSEFALYSIEQDLTSRGIRIHNEEGISIEIGAVLGSVLDSLLIERLLEQWQPHIIFHAAAYKHVSLVEVNSTVGIKNNVLGTQTIANAALKFRIPNFVLISTDKAVRPTNIMGVSKRLAEMILQALAHTPDQHHTNFSIVRFGNVLDSSGSVVPLFRKQIRDGGPLTVTDPEVTRYFMTIPEAAQLVLQASSMSNGGEVFVLDMGGAVKILELARKMIYLSGLQEKSSSTPDGEIEIQITGLRPGEKLYEELLIGSNPMPTSHPRIMQAKEEFLPLDELNSKLSFLYEIADQGNVSDIKAVIQNLVHEYKPSEA